MQHAARVGGEKIWAVVKIMVPFWVPLICSTCSPESTLTVTCLVPLMNP